MRPTLAPPYGKKYLLALIIPALMLEMTQAHAADDDEENLPHSDLGTLIVTATTTPDEQVGESILNRKMLDEQLINDSRDLVRYNPEVDVAEVGRYGNKGFAVRGVDGNRVNMNIDGVALPEAEANEVFSPYGYMYEGRFNPDVEMMRSVRVHAGADSLTSGSGAVGGSVTYNTKRPRDLLNAHSDKPYGGYAKVGYSSKNEERLAAAGLAMDTERFEFLINAAHREGSETKNHDMRRADSARLAPDYIFSAEEIPCIPSGTRCASYTTKSLIYPDPKEFKRNSYLAKLYYKPTEQHRIGIHGMHQRQENHINAESMLTFGGRLGGTTRRAHDVEEITSYGASYRFSPVDSRWLDHIDLSHTYSDVLGLADTWVYNRNLDWQTDELKSVKLSNQEYRPTQTKSHQSTLSLDSQAFNWGAFGEHQFTLRGNYNRQDYTNSALYIGHGSIPNHLSHEFVDARKTNHNLTLTDKIYFNERFDATLGVRYDQYHYAPYFQSNVDGFDEYTNKTNRCKNSYNNTLFCQMHRRGERLSDVKFKHLTWSALANYELIPDKLTARYKIGTGFLAPTVTQLYSDFEGLGARQVPNYNLKPETSLNQELELEWDVNDALTLVTSGYLTKYDDFIHTKYWRGETNGCNNQNTCMQSVNLDQAKVAGLKLGVSADLSNWLDLNGRFVLSANYHTARDSATVVTDNGARLKVNTLAATPTNLLLGANYSSAQGDWELNARMNVIGRKKAQDTKFADTQANYEIRRQYCNDSFYAGYCSYGGFNTYDPAKNDYYKEGRTLVGYSDVIGTYEHVNRSKTAVVYDIYGSKKFGKNQNLILNAGVYNIFNEKYIPWESLRQFHNVNTNNMVDNAGYGFNRYTAPGRNYAVSLTYEF